MCETGLLRINFPGYNGEDSLKEISRDEFFKKFDDDNKFVNRNHSMV